MWEAQRVLSWVKWGVPVTAVVLLAAAAGGLGVRGLYGMARENSASPPTTPTSVRPHGPEPGSPVVELSPGTAEHPDSRKVRSLLQTYFDSINDGRYDWWAATVVAGKRQELPEGKWRDEYSTTRDGSITVQQLEPGLNNSLQVFLTFTSVQDPSHAPPQLREPCVRWRVVYPLVQDSGDLRLDVSRFPGSSLPTRCS